jgi:hypothetical protein
MWTGTDPGAWRLRPWLSDIGGFGEPLQVDVGPEE